MNAEQELLFLQNQMAIMLVLLSGRKVGTHRQLSQQIAATERRIIALAEHIEARTPKVQP